MAGDGGRVRSFAGVHNFRDYGGYGVVQGGALKTGLLYRSAQHLTATDEDLLAIGELGLGGVIDLRSDGERRRSPCPRPEGFGAKVVFVPDTAAGEAPHVEAAKTVQGPEDAREQMLKSYARIPFRPTFTRGIAAYFEALAEIDGPTLIHCMAGKDRTGIAVAVFHIAMGVARHDWMADYLLTNEAGNVEVRIRNGADHIRAAFGKDIAEESIRVLMTVDAAFLDHAIAAMNERHGGVSGYLAACGVTDILVADLRERFIA